MKQRTKKMVALMMTVFIGTLLLGGCGSSNGADQADTSDSQENQAAESENTAEDTTDGATEDAAESTTEESGVTLELMTTWNGERKDALDEVLARFTQETGIQVEVGAPGNEYETVMKTRMASQDLPDLWETHGWSVERYSEYLTPLNDSSWANRVDEAILPVISDENDTIYVAPITMGINTISYSKDAFEKAGIEAGDIRTWEQFEQSCDKLLEAGITPIFIGNKDGGTAQLAEAIPPTYLTNEDVSDNQRENLLGGSFDFDTSWTPISQLVSNWNEKGYFNVDLLTADNESGTKEMGQGNAAMMFGGSNNITQALTFQPEANLGILAVPAVNDTQKNSLSMGEGLCYGIWKDTKYPEEAKKLLDYLAQADIVSELATAAGDMPGFADVENPDDYITKAFRETQATFEGNLIYVPLFDREYLPNGMWDDLTNSFTELFVTPGEEGVKASVEVLKTAYEQKID